MAISVVRVDSKQARRIIATEEGHFSDVKAIEIKPAKLTKTISAFANADGGEIFVGIGEDGADKRRFWKGFADPEAANGHLQIFEVLFPLGRDFIYQFLRNENFAGIVLHIQINKTEKIMYASNKIAYVRRGASSQQADKGSEIYKRLEYSKGITSFESEIVNVDKEMITKSETLDRFIKMVVPDTMPEPWLNKNLLLRNGHPTVAAALLFADLPQAILPKRSGVKIYRYKTKDGVGSRESLAFDPITVEGPLDSQIRSAVKQTTTITENVPRMGHADLEKFLYPSDTLQEIITNAIIHRDYSTMDDVHIRIFDNRIEVMSPGRLPGHITVKNILKERLLRNGSIVRMLNKFPAPVNKDVGEGLNTAFAAMLNIGLKPPVIVELDNAVLVTIKHESLASPEEAIMDYLEIHDTINNKKVREIAYIQLDYTARRILKKMMSKGMIDHVPGTLRHMTCYRKSGSQPFDTPKADEPTATVPLPAPPSVPNTAGIFDFPIED